MPSGDRQDPEFVAHRQLRDEAAKKGIEVSQTRHRTIREGDQQIIRSKSSSRGLRLSKEGQKEAEDKARTEAEFEGFKAVKEEGKRRGYNVVTARVRTDIRGDSIHADVDRVKGVDTLRVGSLTRRQAAEQFKKAPGSLSIAIEDEPDATKGASDFPTMTPATGIRGAAGVSEGFTEYGKYTRVAKKEPITGEGYVAAGFDPDRYFMTQVSLNKKPSPFISAGKELESDFSPSYGGTPYDPGKIGKRDLIGSGNESDPRSFIDAEARNLAVVGQEIVRGNPTFDPYKKFKADLTETQRGGATFKPEITPAGSVFEFAFGSVIDVFSGKGVNSGRAQTLRQELTENPARTLGGALGAVPFFVTPVPLKNPLPFVSKGLSSIRLNVAERALLGNTYSRTSKSVKIRPTTLKDDFLGIKENFRQAEKAEMSGFSAKASSPRSIESQIAKDIQDTNKGLGFREIRGRGGLVTLQRVEQVQKQITKQVQRQKPLPKSITRMRQQEGVLGATLGLGDSRDQVSRILNRRRQKDELSLVSLATPDNFKTNEMIERVTGRTSRQSQLIGNMTAFRTDVRQLAKFDAGFRQMFGQAQAQRQQSKQDFALRSNELLSFQFGQEQAQRQGQLEKELAKMLQVEEFKTTRRVKEPPIPPLGGGAYSSRKRKRKGSKNKYFPIKFTTADIIRGAGYTKAQSKEFQRRYGKF